MITYKRKARLMVRGSIKHSLTKFNKIIVEPQPNKNKKAKDKDMITFQYMKKANKGVNNTKIMKG